MVNDLIERCLNADDLCGICRFSLSGHFGLRYFGTYVAHSEHDCMTLMRDAITAKERELVERNQFWRKQIEEFQYALSETAAELAAAMAALERIKHEANEKGFTGIFNEACQALTARGADVASGQGAP